ncbi:MAG: hypothetical protein ACKOW2_02805 [Sphingobacteriaceae bacterium]
METGTKLNLMALAKWAKVFSIIIFCLFGAYLMYALFVFKKMYDLVGSMNNMSIFTGFVNIIFMLLGLLCVIILIFPTSWLHQFGKLGQRAALLNDETIAEQALHKLKMVFRFCSICLLAASFIITLFTAWWMLVDF